MGFYSINIQYFSLPSREGQRGLKGTRESSLSIPRKAGSSEIQPSVVDSIKTLRDASFSFLREKQKTQDVKSQDIYWEIPGISPWNAS